MQSYQTLKPTDMTGAFSTAVKVGACRVPGELIQTLLNHSKRSTARLSARIALISLLRIGRWDELEN